MNLADNLKKIRKEHNLSQEQLAEKLGVSRQSVSKWESNLAYPEMDKVIQLCKLFDLNMDELLNQDIKEVRDNKQAKININKYIDDFLEYVTKTIDMFTSMTFKEKIKCLFEQFVIIISMVIVFAMVGAFFNSMLWSLNEFLSSRIFELIHHILEDIYFIICFILGVILELHIFKVRYLDYYTIIKEDNKKEISEIKDKEASSENIPKEEGKFIYQQKQQKIIIRDPNHASYKFIAGLVKCLLFGVKALAVFLAIGVCFSLIGFVVCLVLSFLFVKTGLTFLGGILILISAIIIHLIVLTILYHFIISKKNKKMRLAVSFVVSLFFIGVGTGLMFLSFTKYDIIDDMSSSSYVETEKIIPMTENLFIYDSYYNIEYVESPLNDLRIVIKHTNYYYPDIYHHDNILSFHLTTKNDNMMDMVRRTISDINDKKIVNYANYKITIYTSKENMDKLESNKIKNRQKQEEEEKERLYNEVNSLNEKLSEKDEELSEKNMEIDSLKSQLEYYEKEEEE